MLHSTFVIGTSAEQTIACLTRDSYTTHTFVQQLMGVLSLLERTPSPEPVELDFYTEFGKKNTGNIAITFWLVYFSQFEVLQ